MVATDCDVVIIGGGIVGTATAVALAREGVRVKIFDKTKEYLPVGAAIGLFPNGEAALRAISPALAEKVVASSIQNRVGRFYNLEGEVEKETDAAAAPGAVVPRFIVWFLLQQYLREELPVGTMSNGHEFVTYETAHGVVSVTVRDVGTTETRTVTCRLLVGADGVHSAVRTRMSGAECSPNFHGKTMFRAMFEASALDASLVPAEGVQVTFLGDAAGKLFSYRMTSPGLVTLTAMQCFDERQPLLPAGERKGRLGQLFGSYPETVHRIIDAIDGAAIFENNVEDIDILEQWSEGSVILIGDSAHAMTPGLGQGANIGIEDACELAAVVAPLVASGQVEEPAAVAEALRAYWQARLPRVRAVHGRSSMMTSALRKATTYGKAAEGDDSYAEFKEMLYGWTPTAAKV